MSVQVKICGLREPGHAVLAAAHGARWIGVVFFPPSPRYVELDRARAIADVLPPPVEAVGVMVDPDDEAVQAATASGLGALQLHGRETPERIAAVKRVAGVPVIKALGISTPDDARRAASFSGAADMILFDARPPEGATRPRRQCAGVRLAGPQRPRPPAPVDPLGRVDAGQRREAVARSGAAAVDVSSGIERAPGEKDEALIVEFLAAARAPVQRPAPVLQ